MFRRLAQPYNIDYKAEAERELRLQKEQTDQLKKMFN